VEWAFRFGAASAGSASMTGAVQAQRRTGLVAVGGGSHGHKHEASGTTLRLMEIVGKRPGIAAGHGLLLC
jgi:hypothetical protein